MSNHRNLEERAPDLPQYPLPEFGGLYSTDVFVLRGPQDEGYEFLPEKDIFTVDVITVAAYNQPDCKADPKMPGGLRLDKEYENGTMRKISMILRMAKYHGVQHLVLCAFGCGAFRNPPDHIARLYKRALSLPMFNGAFRHVCFAIIEDHNSAGKNVAAFHQVFKVFEQV